MYLKVNNSTNVNGRIRYLIDGSGHDGSAHRNILIDGQNLRLWRDASNQAYPLQSSYFINSQFKQVRELAKNPDKKMQAAHLIISAPDDAFNTDTKHVKESAQYFNCLVQEFMKAHFAETQYLSTVQNDANHLHCHVLINSVRPSDGKCVRTNKFSVDKLRKQWNQHIDKNFLKVAGRIYINPFNGLVQHNEQVTTKGWQQKLKEDLLRARDQAHSLDQYLSLIKHQGITVSERNRHGDWTYHTVVNGKEKKVRDFYQRVDKKTGDVKSTRGLGLALTPKALTQHFDKTKDDLADLDAEIAKTEQHMQQQRSAANQRPLAQLRRTRIAFDEDAEEYEEKHVKKAPSQHDYDGGLEL